MFACMHICKYSRLYVIQAGKYVTMQLCKISSTEVCKFANKYASIQLGNRLRNTWRAPKTQLQLRLMLRCCWVGFVTITIMVNVTYYISDCQYVLVSLLIVKVVVGEYLIPTNLISRRRLDNYGDERTVSCSNHLSRELFFARWLFSQIFWSLPMPQIYFRSPHHFWYGYRLLHKSKDIKPYLG